MTDYIIWIVHPLLYPHSAAFNEVAESLQEAFDELGHTAIITPHKPQTSEPNVIILGANLLQGSLLPVPHYWTIYNLEQIALDSPWLTQQYLDVLRQAKTVWDYSPQNIEQLKALGIEARLLPIGYTANLTRIERAAAPDIDVLHYGSLNERRSKVIEDLKSRGLKVLHAFNVYGPKRDALIARSKLVLNIHFYPTKVFEIVRCSYLMANKICIVSETSPNPTEEEYYRGAIAFENIDSIVHRCLVLYGDEGRRQELAQTAFERFTARPLAPMLDEVTGGVVL